MSTTRKRRPARATRVPASRDGLLRLFTHRAGELFRAEATRLLRELLIEVDGRNAIRRQWISVLVVGEALEHHRIGEVAPFFGAVGNYARPGDELELRMTPQVHIAPGAHVAVIGPGVLRSLTVGMYEQGQIFSGDLCPIVRTQVAAAPGVTLIAKVQVLEP
jgi:hypothetical protein